jgi:murein DD-endopeptidase MepM/ murein hydrolase activator NlpD
LAGSARTRPLPQLYRGRAGRSLRGVLDADHIEHGRTGQFRWLISTCLAAAVGAVAIFVVIYGSSDPREGSEGFLPALKQMGEGSLPSPATPFPRSPDGLKWAVPKTDRLRILTGAVSTRYIIHESLKQRRNGREYIHAKPYLRVVARLAPAPSSYADVIPPFNPFKLFANSQPLNSAEDGADAGTRKDISVRVVELLGGILPDEDGQELDAQEVADIVARAESPHETPQDFADGEIGPIDEVGSSDKTAEPDVLPPNTTELRKPEYDSDDGLGDVSSREIRTVQVGRGDTLIKILSSAGADTWQARSMVEAARGIFPESSLAPGQEVKITLVPSLTEDARLEPAAFSIFGAGPARDHKVTVKRTAAGEFAATGSPLADEESSQLGSGDGDRIQNSSLYASIYYAGLLQHITPETMMRVMQIHAYDTDFRRRIRPGDSAEFFFDVKDEDSTESEPGELLATTIISGNEASRFYRFRTPDGVIDYYDQDGNNSKKFLMRKPVRGEDVRITSGFGYRFHPLLNERRMHTGVDWACAAGTPILAAGSGVIEEAERKGQYGNYVRIRHANGYQTAYGHMLRIAEGAHKGVKVRQGQVIGYVGSTGLSSGPHVHFEVLVNGRFVDPMSIQVPRERKLTGRELADFQKERSRIDELMRRAPVKTETR